MSNKKKFKYLRNLVIGLLISGIALWWALRSIESDKFFEIISSANIEHLLFAAIITSLAYGIRAWRWIFFFQESMPSFRDSYRCLIVGFFMNNILPARLGELVRAHLGGKSTGQSRATVLATIAGERLFDGLSISLIFSLMVTFSSRSEENLNQALTLVAYGFAAIFVATAIVLWQRRKLFSFLEKIVEIFPGHLSNYTLAKIRNFIDGLEPMFKPGRILAISFLSAVIWFSELYAYFQIAQTFSVELSSAKNALFLTAVNFSSLIPAAPGGVGVIEAFASSALASVGLNYESAFALVVTQHVMQILVVGIPGILFFTISMKGKIPDELSDSDEEDSAPSENREAAQSEEDPNKALSSVELSVVIPAYNEEERLPKTLLSVLEYLQKEKESFEIVVVNDGSTDSTAKVVKQFEQLSSNVRLVGYENNQGKGHAVRTGVLSSKGQLVLMNDADGASPIENLPRLEKAIAEGADLAIGSRAMYSNETEIQAVFLRKLMGRCFNGLVNFLLLPGIADTQCGFKLFTKHSAKQIFSLSSENSFSFDVEVLFISRKLGFKTKEVPIDWTNIPGSKVHLIKDSTRMFLDIFKFRIQNLSGSYNSSKSSKTNG